MTPPTRSVLGNTRFPVALNGESVPWVGPINSEPGICVFLIEISWSVVRISAKWVSVRNLVLWYLKTKNMLPFETTNIFEQLPRFVFKMPRVVPDQESKFQSDELFRRLCRESEVSYLQVFSVHQQYFVYSQSAVTTYVFNLSKAFSVYNESLENAFGYFFFS